MTEANQQTSVDDSPAQTQLTKAIAETLFAVQEAGKRAIAARDKLTEAVAKWKENGQKDSERGAIISLDRAELRAELDELRTGFALLSMQMQMQSGEHETFKAQTIHTFNELLKKNKIFRPGT
jgi:hypothetical protein